MPKLFLTRLRKTLWQMDPGAGDPLAERVSPQRVQSEAAAVPARSRLQVDAELVHAPRPRRPGFTHDLLRLPAARHAEALLKWLTSEPDALPLMLFTPEIQAAYADVCIENQLEPLPWQIVAEAFNRLTRQPGRPLKPYGWRTDLRTRCRRRVRVYVISHPMLADRPDLKVAGKHVGD